MTLQDIGLTPTDSFAIPQHVADYIRSHPPLGFFSTSKGKRLTIELCGLCGIPQIVSQTPLENPEQRNEVGALFWIDRPERCSFCGPIFQRYPEMAIWVSRVIAFREYANSDHVHSDLGPK